MSRAIRVTGTIPSTPGSPSGGGQRRHESHGADAPATSPPVTRSETQPRLETSPADPLGAGHTGNDTHTTYARAEPLPGAIPATTPTRDAPQAPSPTPKTDTEPMPLTASAPSGGGQGADDNHTPYAPANHAELRLFAEMFFDVQEFRKSMENKARSATVDPEVVAKAVGLYDQAEHEMSRALVHSLRRVVSPGILAWQKAEKGIGEHLLARLLGAIGTPRVAVPKHWEGRGRENRILVATEPRPRTVSQLWSYCGHGDPSRTMHKGITAEELMARGNPRIKAIVWNIATACVRTGVDKFDNCDDTDGYDVKHREATSHYGDVYLDRRAATLDRTHATECVRCGPAGKPAPIGSPWSRAHQQADGLRIVGKAVLQDLWIAAGGQTTSDVQTRFAPGPDSGGGQSGYETHRAHAPASHSEDES